ncbi:MAG: dihydrodipicolinate synthase family protein [Planctomycetales bacterium]|nr:dihydrodipicolinate synthase family protein [Planctomycetales bacterium]
MSSIELPLRGIVPPMITPLSSPDTIDVEGAKRLTEHLIDGGVHGIFILGSTGEGPSLSASLQRQLIEVTVRQAADRVPILAGITDTCLADSILLAESAADLGVSAVVASAPSYYRIGQPELLDYCRSLIASLPLPLVLYNMPGLTKVSFEQETLRQLLQYDKVIGIKDSSGDLSVAAEYVEVANERPDWMVMTGPEELLAEALSMGVMGGVCGGANLFPRLFVDLYEAFNRNDSAQVQLLHNSVLQIGKLLYGVGKHGSSYIKGIKCALNFLGICDDHMALPFTRFAELERATIKQRLEQLATDEAAGIQAVMAGYSNA